MYHTIFYVWKHHVVCNFKKIMRLLLQENRGRKHVTFDETYWYLYLWYLNRKFHWFYDDTPLKFNIAPQKRGCLGDYLPLWFQDYVQGLCYLDLDLCHGGFCYLPEGFLKKADHRILDLATSKWWFATLLWGVEKQRTLIEGDIWVFPKIEEKNPKIRENPIRNGWFGGYTYFWKHPYITNIHIYVPMHPVIFSDNRDVQSPPKCIVCRFHETILSFGEPGSLGYITSSSLCMDQPTRILLVAQIATSVSCWDLDLRTERYLWFSRSIYLSLVIVYSFIQVHMYI